MSRRQRGGDARHRFGIQRRWPWWAAVVVGLIVLAVLDRRGWLLVAAADDLAVYDGRSVAVVRVIDGDTIEVDVPDGMQRRPVTRVRLWGVDAPESGWDGEAPEPLADAAAAFVREAIGEQRVTLWLEPHRMRGTFARVLAHVELADGTLLNARLLEAGLAELDERSPHRHLTHYAQACERARRAKVGVWE